MTNVFTSINTGGSLGTGSGLSATLVQQAYDLQVGWALTETPSARMFVDKRPGNVAMRAASYKLEKFNYFAAAAVTAAKTPLTEEVDVDSTAMPALSEVILTPAEYGFAVTRTKKLTYRSFADVDPAISRAIAQHQGQTIDSLIQDVITAGATQKQYAGTNTAIGTIAATDVLKATNVRKWRTKLRVQQVTPWSGGAYAAMVHPDVVHDLREETGSGSWRTPNEYGAGDGLTDIFAGEIGEFEGIRFVQNTWTRTATDGASSATVFRSFVFGREGLAEAVNEEPHVVLGPVVDKLQRFRTVGWYGDLGWAVYRPEAIVQFYSGSSVASL